MYSRIQEREKRWVRVIAISAIFSVIGCGSAVDESKVSAEQNSELSDAGELSHRLNEAMENRRYADAVPLAQQILTIQEKALGPNDAEVGRSLFFLSVLY